MKIYYLVYPDQIIYLDDIPAATIIPVPTMTE
jgi:hypothetical protein